MTMPNPIIPDPPPLKGEPYGCDYCIHLGRDKHGDVMCTKHRHRYMSANQHLAVYGWTTPMWDTGECEDHQTTLVTKLCRLVGKRKNREPGWEKRPNADRWDFDPSWGRACK